MRQRLQHPSSLSAGAADPAQQARSGEGAPVQEARLCGGRAGRRVGAPGRGRDPRQWHRLWPPAPPRTAT
ncbi:Hypothetical predicted protein [Lynx pardinus]|uniref:Uncharacterized protein n=1 Tax=Lynx pardinus TaxID=191816 RepID=A0A485PTK9_LYNPA|nr:Hypothetical predicted protein [Lynx pardinus]